MTDTDGEKWLERVYESTSEEDLKAAYDDWAAHYDDDVVRFGYRVPAIAAGLFARYVPRETRPVLDAGAGTGLGGETLHFLGYEAITGIDLSEGMLAVAAAKNIYAELRRMRLGARLDFEDDSFGATQCIGTLTVGHAGPDAFDELIRVTRPGGHIVFSIRVDGGAGDAYLARQKELVAAGAWRLSEETPALRSMPVAEPDVLHRVYAYRIA